MKKLFVIVIVSLFTVGAMAHGNGSGKQGDDRQSHREQIIAMRIGYFTEQLSLTPEQSAKFWPLYNEFWAKKREQFSAKHKIQKKMREGVATEVDIDEMFRIDANLLALDKEYASKLVGVISMNQVGKMFVAEEDFKSVLLRTYNRGGGGGK